MEALSRANSRARDIGALGITNQRETTIAWERKTGKPVHNAIVWQDRRTAPICKGLWEQGLEGTMGQQTGLLIDAYFSARKIMWILENVKGAREKADAGELAFGAVDSWLIWNLEDSGIPIKVLRADGGAARIDTLLQFQADLLGIREAVPSQQSNEGDGQSP